MKVNLPEVRVQVSLGTVKNGCVHSGKNKTPTVIVNRSFSIREEKISQGKLLREIESDTFSYVLGNE